MKSRASWLAALLLAGWTPGIGEVTAAPQQGGLPRADGAAENPDAATGATPDSYRPSTGERTGEVRYDEVGYAGWSAEVSGGTVGAAHATLASDSYAEVTALDTGKTILLRIDGPVRGGAKSVIELPARAAQPLGIAAGVAAPVRVRAVTPSPVEAAALAAGQAVPARAEAPPILLTALRRKLGPAPAKMPASSPPVRQAVRPAVQPPRPERLATRGFLVQVAALSSAARARSVADRLAGQVVPAGHLYRIQLGPFSNAGAAQKARAAAARQGFPDARVISSN